MAEILESKISSIDQIGPSIYRMKVISDSISQKAMPGQFINIKCGEGLTPLLRRPISICDVDRKNGTFDVVFQTKGEGTANLSKRCCGDTLDYIGPLGNTFDFSGEYKNILVVGGGIGVFPLLFLLKESNNRSKTAILGFRSKEYIVLQDEFKNNSDKLVIATDDGSFGVKGFITDVLKKELEKNKIDIIYACGPTPMLKGVAQIAVENKIKCQLSMEQRMGCGIGACLVCACKTSKGDGWAYSHVCKDGPVFWAEDVIFE